jgi:hypothetical protein
MDTIPPENQIPDHIRGQMTSEREVIAGRNNRQDMPRDVERSRLADLLGSLLAAHWIRGSQTGSASDRDPPAEKHPEQGDRPTNRGAKPNSLS